MQKKVCTQKIIHIKKRLHPLKGTTAYKMKATFMVNSTCFFVVLAGNKAAEYENSYFIITILLVAVKPCVAKV
jgi:hypothetical protein